MPVENSPFYKSKRFWVNIAMVVAAIYPKSKSFIEANLAETSAAWATINIVLGFISKGKISLS